MPQLTPVGAAIFGSSEMDAAEIDGSRSAVDRSCPVEPLAAGRDETFAFPLSLTQQRHWLFDQMAPGNPGLNMSITLHLEGALDKSRLAQCLDETVARHEALRTTFEIVGGNPIQLIHSAWEVVLEYADVPAQNATDRQALAERMVREEALRPIALSAAPLLRAKLLRLEDDKHILIITLPHIITDGWSNGILVRELTARYEAHTRNLIPALPEIPIQYADFAVWQQDWLKNATFDRDLNYWRETLHGRLPILDLPTDRPVVPGIVAIGATATTTIAPETVARMKGFCRQEDVTLFMFFLAVFKALMFRYTGQADILVGSPVAGRTSETENTIGPFASSICLRSELLGNPTFRELLHRVSEVVVGALEHKDLPFERLLHEVDTSQIRGRNPLFQIYFLHQVGFLQPTQAGEVVWTPLNWESPGAFFDLFLAMLERPNGTAVRLEYRAEQFEATTIQTMLSDFRALADAVVRNPEAYLSELEVTLKPVEPEGGGERREMSPLNGHQADATPSLDAEAAKLLPDVIAIWREIFGGAPIRANDDFLALGGTSILATKLIAQLNEVFSLKLPPAFLFGFPTPVKLAMELRNQTGRRSSQRVVALQAEGGESPFFIVGAATRLVALVKRTTWKHPILSLLGDDELAVSGHYDLRKEAGEHVRTILETQKQGPYLIGGFSAGGIIAYEMAQQLLAGGHKIALLVLFDVANPFFMRQYSGGARFWDRLHYSWRFHRAQLTNTPIQAIPGYIASRVRRRLNQSAEPEHADPVMVRIVSARHYHPQPLKARVLLFKRHSVEFLGRHADPLFGWGDVAKGDVEICVMECAEHLDIFAGANGDILARKLHTRLGEAVREATLGESPHNVPDSQTVKGPLFAAAKA
jgi:thioesterase domain-containing protein